MTKLPHYYKSKECPKCGEQGASTTFHDELHHYGSDRVDPEYLLRCCTNCHYEWKEMPLDAKDEEAK